MERITVTFFKKHFAEILEKVKRGESMAITDNGEILAKLVPYSDVIKQTTRKGNHVTTKEEFDARMAELAKAYSEGKLSIKDSYFANVEPIDMGPTNSSDIDSEIYR